MKDHNDSVYRNHHLRVPAVLIAVGVQMPGLVTPLAVTAMFIAIQNLERPCTSHRLWEITLGYIR